MIGLTGGIGSGKSTVAQLFKAKGAFVLDADAIAREVVEPGEPALYQLVQEFGEVILLPSGELDRAKLAELAFKDEASHKKLEEITHPAIGARFIERLGEAPAGAVVIHEIPLLVEARRQADYEAIVVVEAPAEVRVERLILRGLKEEDARARLAQQASDEERRAVATWVIDNSKGEAELQQQVDEIWPDLVSRFGGEQNG